MLFGNANVDQFPVALREACPALAGVLDPRPNYVSRSPEIVHAILWIGLSRC